MRDAGDGAAGDVLGKRGGLSEVGWRARGGLFGIIAGVGLVLAGAPSAGRAEDGRAAFDGPRWLAGCVALAVPGIMGEKYPLQVAEMNCVTQAVTYCGRPGTEAAAACLGRLADMMGRQTEALVPRLETAEGPESGFSARSFARGVEKLAAPAERFDCPVGMSEPECALLGVSTRWLEARRLARLAGLEPGR